MIFIRFYWGNNCIDDCQFDYYSRLVRKNIGNKMG
jgi:hypothetical protein